jgi:cell division transport system ATP-binding protein
MMFEVQNVTVTYDGFHALRDVTCTIDTGTVTILTGPTGAGKTTLLRLLYADILPTSGEILVDGRSTRSMKGRDIRALRRSLGIVQQDCRLMSHMSVFENVLMPLALGGSSKIDATRRALEILADLNVSYVRHKLPSQLSGGERHLVALARALAVQPAVIIADEPTGTLDERTSLEVAHALNAVAATGTNVILSTHSTTLPQAFTGAQRIVIDEGRLQEISSS